MVPFSIIFVGEFCVTIYTPRFKAIVFYSTTAEEAHVQFGEQTVDFFKRLNYGEGYYLDIATDFSGYDYEKLKEYNTVVWVNTSPYSKADREAFQKYMENGGGWVGFHAAAYNDIRTDWPWFNEFLGCGKFLCNNWPPQPALLDVEITDHPVTRNLPESFVAPASEWYMWDKSPRLDKNVDVLLSLSPKNYPIGIKDVVSFGDFPVVWTNNRYRMIYLNMGHGDVEYLDAEQNLDIHRQNQLVKTPVTLDSHISCNLTIHSHIASGLLDSDLCFKLSIKDFRVFKTFEELFACPP